MPQKRSPLLSYDKALAKFHAAGLDDLSKKWLQNKADRKELPCVVIANKRRFLESDIDRMIDGFYADVC